MPLTGVPDPETELYLRATLARHRVGESPDSTPHRVRRLLLPLLERWGGGHLESVTLSGSFPKGTAIRNASLFPDDVDVDLLLSLSPDAPGALQSFHESLARDFRNYLPRPGNVSVRIRFDDTNVDLVPARRRTGSAVHSLWQSRRGTWLQTDVAAQIGHVRGSGLLEEIRAVKIWRRRQAVEFPSYYLELAVMRAFADKKFPTSFDRRVLKVLEFLADGFVAARITDPANSNNCVSDLLAEHQKAHIARVAGHSVEATDWGMIL